MNLNQEYSIECELCGRQAVADMDKNDNPEAYFKSLGWDEDDGWTLCPHCAKGEVLE